MSPRAQVFVARELPGPALDLIRAQCDVDLWREKLPPPREVLLSRSEGKDGLLTLLTDRVDGELLDRAGEQLKVVSNYAIGFDNVDVPEATARGIMVCNTPDVLTETTADLTFALILAGARRLVEGVDFVRQDRWKTWDPQGLLGHDVYGSTLGILGMGRIGAAVARRALGFGMNVVALTRNPSAALQAALGLRWVESLDELLQSSDIVSLHAPLTEKTHHIIGSDQLARMKSTALLVNTARGPLIDTPALVAALRNGEIAGAALDVTDPEPLPANHPLVQEPKAIVVPHIGSASEETRSQMALRAAENLLRALRGERPRFVVNPEVFENL